MMCLALLETAHLYVVGDWLLLVIIGRVLTRSLSLGLFQGDTSKVLTRVLLVLCDLVCFKVTPVRSLQGSYSFFVTCSVSR